MAADGTLSDAIRYDPYGDLRPGSASPSDFGYTGEWTSPSGLVNLRARAYNPSLGRFISADTYGGELTNPLSANRYAYGLGNPLAYTDPSGHIGNAIGFVLSHPSLVILLIPGIGEAYGLACGITGQDLLTGEQLSPGERLLFAAGALGKLGMLGTTLAKVTGKLLSTLGKSLGAGMRAMGTAVKAPGRGLRELGAAIRGETKAGRELAGVDAAGRGVVEFRVFEGTTREEIAQFREYVRVCNEALDAGALSPTGRVATSGKLAQEAKMAAAAERLRALRAGTPYRGVAGHGPDTTWTGNPQAFKWLDLSSNVNSSLAGQVNRYRVGFGPTGFRLSGVPGAP